MENYDTNVANDRYFDVIEVYNGSLFLSEKAALALYDAVDTGKDPSKLDLLRKKAEEGEVWAMFYYARLYHLSNGVEKNLALAVQYYTKAARAGNMLFLSKWLWCKSRLFGSSKMVSKSR